MKNKNETIKIMISSTTLDLPEHRKLVIKTCSSLDMQPLAMEFMTASKHDPVAESLKLVNSADIYLGIFGHRYGYIPPGKKMSITEIELRQAQRREIPIFIFLMREDHEDLQEEYIAKIVSKKNLNLKKELKQKYTVGWFSNPWELSTSVALSLAKLANNQTVTHCWPLPPDPYIAHPYTLLDPYALVGRQEELTVLNQWLSNAHQESVTSSILSIIAIGGMGKSALLWRWFNDNKLNNFALSGRIWWSFYENESDYDNFILHSLAYVTAKSIEDVPYDSTFDRENLLLKVLSDKQILIILDGLERTLVAYHNPDSCISNSNEKDFDFGQNDLLLRRTSDHRFGIFLRKFTKLKTSKIITSTRLHPADLEDITGEPIPGVEIRQISGLKDDDSIKLWKSLGVHGESKELNRLFRSFDNYPLLIRALAKEVSTDLDTPRDFKGWVKNHPKFDPYSLGRNLFQRKHHVLHYALSGLNTKQKLILNIVSSFRLPIHIRTILEIANKLYKDNTDERSFKYNIESLKDRGLIGWDLTSNNIDAHPVIKGLILHKIEKKVKDRILNSIRLFLQEKSGFNKNDNDSFNPLENEIELYSILIRLEEYENAIEILQDKIIDSLASQGQYGQIADLISFLLEKTYGVRTNEIAFFLSIGIHFSGHPQRSLLLYEDLLKVCSGDSKNIILLFYGKVLVSLGRICEAEETIREAFISYIKSDTKKDIITCYFMISIAEILIARKNYDEAKMWIKFVIDLQEPTNKDIIASECSLAQVMILQGDYKKAIKIIDGIEYYANSKATEIKKIHVVGAALLKLDNYVESMNYLNNALRKAREARLLEDELNIALELSDCYIKIADYTTSIELLSEVLYNSHHNGYFLIADKAIEMFLDLLKGLSELSNKNETKRILIDIYFLLNGFCSNDKLIRGSSKENPYILLENLKIQIEKIIDFKPLNKGLMDKFNEIVLPALAEMFKNIQGNKHESSDANIIYNALALYEIIEKPLHSDSEETKIKLAENLHKKAELLIAAGDHEQALVVFNEALQLVMSGFVLNGNNVQSQLLENTTSIIESKIQVLVSIGRTKEAIETIDEFTSSIGVVTGSNIQLFLGCLNLYKARLYKQSNDHRTTIKTYQKIIKKCETKIFDNRSHTNNILVLGMASIKALYLTSRPDSIDVLFLIASYECSKVYACVSCIDEAVKILDNIIEKFGDFNKKEYIGLSNALADILLEKADLLRAFGRIEDAKNNYTIVVNNFSSIPLMENRIITAKTCLNIINN